MRQLTDAGRSMKSRRGLLQQRLSTCTGSTLLVIALAATTCARAAASVKLVGEPTALTIGVSGCITKPAAGKSSPSAVKPLETERCPLTGRGRQLVGVGRLSLALQATSPEKIDPSKVGLSFVSSADGSEDGIVACSRVIRRACIAVSRPEEPKGIAILLLRFPLFSGESMRALTGTLIVEANGEEIPVPVSASPEDVSEVRVEPTSIHLSGSARTISITATGPGVGSLLERQARPPQATLLHGPNGHTAKVTVGPFTATAAKGTSATPLSATAPVKFTGSPPPGTYTGKVSLSQLATAGPALEVQADSGHSYLWAFLLVAAGVILAQLIGPSISVRRRGQELATVLQRTTTRYEGIERKLRAAGYLDGATGVIWDIGSVVVPTTEPSGLSRPLTIAELREQIESERDDEDFNEDRQVVLEVIAHVSRWLRVAPLAVALSRVAANSEGQLKETTKTVTATRLLQLTLRREPADADKADDLVERVLDQIRWHTAYCQAWTTAKTLEQAKGYAIMKKLTTIDAKWGAPGALDRKSSETDTRVDELNVVREQLGLPKASLPSAKELQLPGTPPITWEIPAQWFTGWSLLNGFRFHSLKLRSAAKYIGRVHKPERLELVWSIALLLIIAAVYTFTIYDATWGSFKDLVTAFTAGLGGTITLKIALPIFKSQRLRATTKS
jgi:hypothetical protein